MLYQYAVMGDFLRLWFTNAVFLGAAIAAIRTVYSRLGGKLDVKYTLREALVMSGRALRLCARPICAKLQNRLGAEP